MVRGLSRLPSVGSLGFGAALARLVPDALPLGGGVPMVRAG